MKIKDEINWFEIKIITVKKSKNKNLKLNETIRVKTKKIFDVIKCEDYIDDFKYLYRPLLHRPLLALFLGTRGNKGGVKGLHLFTTRL